MEKRILKTVAGCVMLGALIFASCRKIDNFDNLKVVNYDAEFAIPLFHAKTSFQDILDKFDEDTYVEIGPDQLITLFYKGDVAGRASSDILDSLNAYPLLADEITDTIYTRYLEFPNSIDVDFVLFKSGLLRYFFKETLPGPVTVKFWIPGLTLGGVPFEDTYTTTNTLEANYLSPPFDLTGYKLAPDNDSLKMYYKAYHEDTITSQVLPNFGYTMTEFEFSYVEGYLGNDVYELEPDTIVIDFFENWTRGDVYFADPKINLIVENSFGFPVRSKAKTLNVFTVDDEIKAIESIYLDSIIVDYPGLDEVGETKYTTFDFNKDNSNIDSILGAGPVAIEYDFDVVANPDSNATIRGFMTDESEMNVQVEVELPMYGAASGFEARDTFGINFDSYENFDDVEFKIISENGIPLDVGIQIYFADQNGTVLDSLFTPGVNILEAAPVDGTGIPTAISEKTTFTTFGGVRFEKIKTAKQLFLRSSFSTVNNGETIVKILSTQEVKIRMGMKIGLSG